MVTCARPRTWRHRRLLHHTFVVRILGRGVTWAIPQRRLLRRSLVVHMLGRAVTPTRATTCRHSRSLHRALDVRRPVCGVTLIDASGVTVARRSYECTTLPNMVNIKTRMVWRCGRQDAVFDALHHIQTVYDLFAVRKTQSHTRTLAGVAHTVDQGSYECTRGRNYAKIFA